MDENAVSEYARVDTIFAAFERTAVRYPDKPALLAAGGRGRTLTFFDILQAVRKLSAGLRSDRYEGVNEIGLLSENRPEWPIAYLAVLAAGKAVVPIDANLKPNEITDLVRQAGLNAIITSPKFEDTLAEAGIDRLLSFGANSPYWWENEFGDSADFFDAGRRDGLAALIYTSGTTGSPKAVMLTHHNLLSNLEAIESVINFGPKDICFSILPLHHTFESTCGFLTPLTAGASIVYARSYKSREIVEDISRNNVTFMSGVPLLYEKMYQAITRGIKAAPAFKRVMFKLLYSTSSVGWSIRMKWGKKLFAGLSDKGGMTSVRMFVSGGAPLPPHIAKFFNLIGVDFLQGYGMTECSPVVSVNRPDDIKFGSVGPPLDAVEVMIHEPGPDGVGEILVRGGNVTQGYKDNPEQTAALFYNDWLRTGDLGHLKGGHLWITGRAKNLIVSAAGKNIYPEELEERLVASPLIGEALVFGRQKENTQGEEVRALIVPDAEVFEQEFGSGPLDPTDETVQAEIKKVVDEVNHHVADYKRITGFDVQTEELEKTTTRKIKRYVYDVPIDRKTSK